MTYSLHLRFPLRIPKPTNIFYNISDEIKDFKVLFFLKISDIHEDTELRFPQKLIIFQDNWSINLCQWEKITRFRVDDTDSKSRYKIDEIVNIFRT